MIQLNVKSVQSVFYVDHMQLNADISPHIQFTVITCLHGNLYGF